ncbi:glycosyltransferase family 2 protein [uncultured Massilia sp.]|uniref:glycosyltransferase family 2 protein n=1 Tax=uncultured Massilia sp. TaxID=169973 RepID=UPI0025CCEF31|nr:glycosyltransferase family 2 protein [uncultured Massilia sp.]
MIDANTLAQWSVIRAMQEIEAHPEWDAQQQAKLYLDWLAAGPHGDAYAAHYNLGALYQNGGRLAEAEEQYRAALRLVDLPAARFNLGLLMEQGGRPYEALGEWQALLPAAAQSPGTAPDQLGLQALSASIGVARRLGQPARLQGLLELSLALQPEQPQVGEELAALRGAGPVPGADDAVIYVLAVCFNEAKILPFFLDHYIKFLGAKKVILHDGGSTDGTAEIAARYPEVELIVKVSEKLDDRELMAIRNEAWKTYRDECDWMIVGDVDEFLYHPRMRDKLAEFKRDGVTLPMVEGFEMRSKEYPRYQPGRYLFELVHTGLANPQYSNKNLIFDPKIDINYSLGCHNCNPTGPVKRSSTFVFKNLHYSMLSHEIIVEKSRRSAARLSDWNKETNAGFHYQLNAAMPRADYNRWFAGASDVVAPRQRPALQRPVFDAVLQHLFMLDENAVVVELGAAPGFGRGGDSGSTELLAWYVHGYAGSFTSVEADPLLRRHVAHSLAGRGLGLNVAVAAPGDALPAGIDLLVVNSVDYLGDDADRARCRQAALEAFQAVEPQLADEAVVVLDGIEDGDAAGKFAQLVPYLKAQGYVARNGGYAVAFSKQPLKTA